MGILRYPGAPDWNYDDEVLATIRQIIVVQQRMGQGFWLERRGMDNKTIGHDAIWIHPDQPVYIEFESLDSVPANKELLAQWETFLTVEGAQVLELHPEEETMMAIKKYVADHPEEFTDGARL